MPRPPIGFRSDDPESPRPGGRQQAAGELALQQPDGVEDDGQHRDDPGGALMPEAQHHEDHDPGVRHAFITAALDAGVPLRDVQEAASHADPRTTMRYNRVRTSLDRHRHLHRRGSSPVIPSR